MENINLISNVIKQHTVPRFLLDNFGFSAKGKRKQLYTFDKKSEREYQQSVFDATTRNRFYNIDNHPEKESLEPLLEIYESKAAPIINKLIEQRSIKVLTSEEKQKLAIFVAIQRARSSGELERIKDMCDVLSNKLSVNGATSAQILKALEMSSINETQHVFLRLVADAPTQAKLLLNKDWYLYETKEDELFYISDNPITFHNLNKNSLYGNIGLNVIGIQIHMPISSTLCLAILCPSIREQYIEKHKNYLEIKRKGIRISSELESAIRHARKFINKTTMKQTHENVKFLNSLQVAYSEQYIFSQNNRFDLVKEMINNDDKYKNGFRAMFS
ncbi:DUF4238 domain-containing protein [Proteus vulgaris]|uniref:DUF4238 domain-containing protein n=1 Tax=Proteus TaxID=583 RepID=UPI0013D3ECDE|nr:MULTISPECIES: DUF4238 domain-containing protein [Proteus]MBC6385878.1 hypothetical protein [Proteus mirabilis]MBS3866879.1 DUF4238 domain-containing protein [Proteus mirabilis]MBW3473832.1 DUF4238 domain-containing protein [Proteus vulgaris]MDF7481506.1 DUF4238 domain-containing protein [Proteus mirabilis]